MGCCLECRFLELESCEKCFRELNFILSASLCNSNVDELKDVSVEGLH